MQDAEQGLSGSELDSLSGLGSGLDRLMSALERHGLIGEEAAGRWVPPERRMES